MLSLVPVIARAVGLLMSDQQHLSAKGTLFMALSPTLVSCLGTVFWSLWDITEPTAFPEAPR